MLKWTIKLSEFEITYSPQTSVKGHALADFIVELSPKVEETEEEFEPEWVWYVDGFSCLKGSGTGIYLVGPEGFSCDYSIRFGFKATNNMAEYEALVLGLRVATELKVKSLKVNSDSQLILGQVKGNYQI